MQQNLFITLEGVEGAGKSSMMAFIANLFLNAGHGVVQTREPGGTKTGEQIREILLDSSNIGLTKNTELLLMFSARMQHIEEVIKPALKANQIVLCDRFTDASYAYQGGGRGISTQKIEILESWVQEDLKPDLTLLFDLDVKTGLMRAGKRSAADRFEQEESDFFQRIRSCYLERAKEEPERFRIIDAAQEIADVQAQLKNVIQDFL